ncbi:hypothetical protein BC629DRAFT_1516488, partial [Irpex lacteus]
MGHRLPTILGKAIEDVLCTLNALSSEDEIVDLLTCVQRMQTLKAEMEGNGKLRPIVDDGEADVALISRVWYRQRFHERHLVVCGGVQVPPSEGVLHR